MLRSDDLVRLRHILDAATTAITIFAGRSLEQLDVDQRDRLAIERHLEIVGKAANHVSPTTMARLDGLPWRDMFDMRSVVIHAYFDIKQFTEGGGTVGGPPATFPSRSTLRSWRSRRRLCRWLGAGA